MTTIKCYPVNENGTGSFQELAHAEDVTFGQLSILKVNKGCKRGGHFHEHKVEWFCCIQGRCEMRLTNVVSGKTRLVTLDGGQRQFLKVMPYEKHTVVNKGCLACELLVIASEVYDSRNTDTIRGGE